MSFTRLRREPGRTSYPPGRAAPVEVTVVVAHGCILCEDAVEELDRRADALSVTVVQADEPTGRELVQRHRPVMFPLVLVDGVFLSSGRLPRRKLDQVLAARAREGATS